MASSDKRTVEIDLSEWGWGDWPEQLAKAVSETHGVLNIKLRLPDLSAPIVQKIVKEAFEVFFGGDETFASLTPEGVKIEAAEFGVDENGAGRFVIIPWADQSNFELGQLAACFYEECENHDVADPAKWLADWIANGRPR
jgi:hypothetical protein